MQQTERQALIKKYNAGTINHHEIGKLRKTILVELLESIVKVDAPQIRDKWLDKKASKLSTSKLAVAVGFGTKNHNIRQSYKLLVNEYEQKLKDIGVITTEKLTNSEVSADNASNFIAFIDERLADSHYHWPRNDKGGVYRRMLWAMYLNIDPIEISQAPSFFNRNSDVADKLKEIDLLLIEDKVRHLDYKSESALDAMSETMQSRALSTMRAELKQVKEELVILREQNAKYEQQLMFYKAKEEARSSSGIGAFKMGSAH